MLMARLCASIHTTPIDRINRCIGIAFITSLMDEQKDVPSKKKLPAVGTIQYFTIVRIGRNNVKNEFPYRRLGQRTCSILVVQITVYAFILDPAFFQKK